jgi:Amt family ammonium transporter
VSVYSFGLAVVIWPGRQGAHRLRVKPEVEIEGIDVAEHAESAYDFTSPGGGRVRAPSPWRASRHRRLQAEVEEPAESVKVSG